MLNIDIKFAKLFLQIQQQTDNEIVDCEMYRRNFMFFCNRL